MPIPTLSSSTYAAKQKLTKSLYASKVDQQRSSDRNQPTTALADGKIKSFKMQLVEDEETISEAPTSDDTLVTAMSHPEEEQSAMSDLSDIEPDNSDMPNTVLHFTKEVRSAAKQVKVADCISKVRQNLK